MKLDEVDARILKILRQDARRPYSEIAREVGRTEVTVRRRIRNLVKEGIIKRFTVVVDRKKIGMTVSAMVRVKTAMSEATAIAERVRDYEEVDEACYLDGPCGILLRVTVGSLNELREFIEKKLGQIEEVETCIVLDTVKSSA
ncbi:MAG: Lrp/AsnC family transcriptional regulator [Candidatus Thorarchaeota archaeon]